MSATKCGLTVSHTVLTEKTDKYTDRQATALAKDEGCPIKQNEVLTTWEKGCERQTRYNPPVDPPPSLHYVSEVQGSKCTANPAAATSVGAMEVLWSGCPT
jgi:hypothetical protein